MPSRTREDYVACFFRLSAHHFRLASAIFLRAAALMRRLLREPLTPRLPRPLPWLPRCGPMDSSAVIAASMLSRSDLSWERMVGMFMQYNDSKKPYLMSGISSLSAYT